MDRAVEPQPSNAGPTEPDPGRPSGYARRVLLAVAGLTPQVVTETVWSLAQGGDPWLPTEIRLVTTAPGRERVRLLLLDPEEGALAALARDLDRPALATALDETGIRVVEVAGAPLDDVDSAAAHMAVADALIDEVRAVTEDPDSALHVSLAGGRKTMGFLAGHALSLLGRPQDRLSHVLVDRAAESHPQFFFPPKRPRVLLAMGDQRPFKPSADMVRLVEIPFVRLRDGLPPGLLTGRQGYAETVAAAQRALEPPRLEIDLAQRRIVAGGVTLKAPPLQAAFLLWLARRRPLGDAGAVRWDEADPEELAAAYGDWLGPAHPEVAAFRHRYREGLEKERFDEWKARHDKLVTAALGAGAAPYRIVGIGKRPRTRFRLAIEPSAIVVIVARSI